jgi:glycosyltransferase involved in cell wall biosynthesis
MRILIATALGPPRASEGTELADGLRRELAARGFSVEVTRLPYRPDWAAAPGQTVGLRLLDVTESCGDRIDRVIALRAPCHSLRHPNKVAWLADHHREAYDLWGTPWGAIPDDPVGRHHRDLIRRADDAYLGECRAVYAVSVAAAARLRRFTAVAPSGVLYPPLPADHRFRPGPFGGYLVCPGNLVPVARHELAIDALRAAGPGVRVVFTGAAGVANYRAALGRRAAAAGVADRVEFVVPADVARRAELLAGCLGVLTVPYRAGDAAPVLEAYHAGKPVVTTFDAGTAAEFVVHEATGLVRPSDPEALGEALGRLARNRRRAAEMGAAGRDRLATLGISWDNVIERLTA